MRNTSAFARIPKHDLRSGWRDGAGGRTLCLRTTGRSHRVIGAIRREAAGLDPAIPIVQTLTLADQFDNGIAQERMLTTLCGFFGILAVLLAAIGLYGVMAHAVARRVREIGIRMALGARAGEVLWLIFRETASWSPRRRHRPPRRPLHHAPRRTFLFGLTPQDPLTIAASTVVLLAVTASPATSPPAAPRAWTR